MEATPVANSRFEPLTDLSAVPQEVIDNYLLIVGEEDGEDPDAAYARQIEAIIVRKHREGWKFFAYEKDIQAELLRRRGKEVPLEIHQVYDWNGVAVEILAMSRKPYGKQWANIRCAGPAGATWRKRMALPLPDSFRLIGWMR